MAPSYFVPRHGTPQQIAHRVLARFGDDRYVHAVSYVQPPAHPGATSSGNGNQRQGRKIGNRLWALLQTPAARQPRTVADPEDTATISRAEWETYLVGGALRDEICAAGRRPLVGGVGFWNRWPKGW